MRVALLCAVLALPASAAAQTAPPIHGLTGSIATDATVRDEGAAAGAIARGAKKILFLGGARTDQNPLNVLIEGNHVLVKDGGSVSEGVVIDINRNRRQITVRFPDRHTEVLRVAEPSGVNQTGRVVVSLVDQRDATAYGFIREF